MASVTLDVIMRFVDQTSSKLSAVNAALNQVNQQGAKVNTTMQALQTGLKGITLFGAYEGIKQISAAFYDLAKQGAEFERAMTSFQVMTSISGERYVDVLGDMRAATRGTVSDMQLMLSANKALSLGVAETSEDLARLVETSTVLGRRTGLGQEQALERLMVGIGRLSPRILDDLGIAVNLTRLYREETGKASSELDQETKIHILMQKVLEDGAEILKRYPEGLDDAASAFERLNTIIANTKTDIGQSDWFQGGVGWLDDRTMEAMNRRIVKNAEEGKASIEEITNAIKFYNDYVQQMRAGGIWHFDAQIVEEATDSVDKLTRALHLANLEADELATKREFVTAVTPKGVDPETITKEFGPRILATLDDLEQAKRDLAGVSIGSDEAEIAKYAARVEQLTQILKSYGYAYNIAAEQTGAQRLDEVALAGGALVIEQEAQAYDVLVEAENLAAAASDRLTAAQKKMEEQLRQVHNVILELSDAQKKALSGDIIALLTKDPSSGAQQAASQANAVLSDQLYYLENISSKWMTEQEAAIAAGQAYDRAASGITNYQEKRDALVQSQNLSTAGGIGADIVRLTSLITEATSEFGPATADAALKAAGGLTAVQEQLRALGEQYNAIAALAGLPLIDIEALARGEVKAYDASAAFDVLNQKQQEVVTMAQLAGGALTDEAMALAGIEGILTGFKGRILSAITSGGDVFGVDQQIQMYHENVAIADQALKEFTETGEISVDTQIKMEAAVRGVVDPINKQAQAIRTAESEAKSYAETIQNKLNSALNSLNSIVSGELKDSLNELSNVGIGEKDFAEFGARQDVPAENARRLAALMKEGVKDQPWLEEFKAEAPGVWDEYINAADPAAAAARMLQEFQLGLRPELIDFGQLKQQIKDKIATQLRLEDMGAQLTAELIAEMGTADSSMIQRFVGDALGTGIEDSPFASDASAKLLSQFQSPDFAEQMKTAGGVSAMNWALGFNNDVPEYMLPFIDILASYVLPIVQANIVATATNTGAK